MFINNYGGPTCEHVKRAASIAAFDMSSCDRVNFTLNPDTAAAVQYTLHYAH